MDVTDLNSLDRAAAIDILTRCCGSRMWVDRMIAARPFRNATAVLTAAEEVWWDLGAEDWEEAFTAHRQTRQSQNYPDYEEEFGYPYVVFAADRSTEELSALSRERLGRDPLLELRVIAIEQARLTNLALRQLLAVA